MSSASTLSHIPRFVDKYADAQHVNADGCRSTFDIDERRKMLNNIARGHENGWLR